MGRTKIRKEDILAKVNTYDIFRHFLHDRYSDEGRDVKPGVHIYVPEISGLQKTPSFNVYLSRKSGEYRYKDFVGNDGSVFDFVMNFYNASFTESLSIINKEMNLGLESEDIDYKKVQPKPEIRIESERNYSFDIKYDKWRKRHLEYWAAFGTDIKTLEKYAVRPVFRLSAFRRDGSPYEIESRLNSLIFAFVRDGWLKIYMPEIKHVQSKRFMYIGKKPETYVFGLEQLPKRGKDLYLVAGEKDCLNMHSHGLNAVCLTSEESVPSNYPDFIKLLESDRFENYYVLYDQDITGRKRAKAIVEEFPKMKIKRPPLEEGQDISDYLIKQYKKKMF